jgi:predicted DCC family thiol-disulfide oxidoreductase YuxK
MSGERNKVTVYYDGACPICVSDRAEYERLAGEGGKDVIWFDINGRDAELRALGIEPHKALTELHIMDVNGQIRSEMDAYIVLMGRVPRLKLLGWFISLPLIRPLLGKLYRRMVRRRLRRQGRL